ncbi:MAG: caspase family protein, partial [Nitrospira sp.]|nr:caspase family protein [Nitrospira sp.]
GEMGSALTYYLVESIKEAEGKLTYRELHRRTLAKLKAEDFDQIPQLEGQRTSFDRQFLS